MNAAPTGQRRERSHDVLPMKMASVHCSLCRTKITFELSPSPVEVRCGSCGLSFQYDAHIKQIEAEETRRKEVRKESIEGWLSDAPSTPRPLSDWQILCRHGKRYAPIALGVAAALLISTVTAVYGIANLQQTEQAVSTLSTELGDVAKQRDDALNRVSKAENVAVVALTDAQKAAKARDDALAALERERERRLAIEQERNEYALKQRRFQERSDVLRAEELLVKSRELLEVQPKQSLYYACEATQLLVSQNQPITLPIEQTLRDALSRNGGMPLRGHELAIETLAVSKDGRWLLTGSCDKTARLWDLASPTPSSTSIVLDGHDDRVTSVAITPDSHWAITAGRDGLVIVWDLRAEDPAATSMVLGTHRGPISSIAVSPDGRWLVTASEGHGDQGVAARLWNIEAPVASARPLLLGGHTQPIRCISITPDSKWVVLGSEDETVRLFDLRDPIRQVVLKGHRGFVTAVAASPDGRWIVTGSADNTARLWDLTTDSPKSEVLEGHEGWIDSIAISPDGRWVGTGSYDNTARLWDCHTGQSIKLEGHSSRIHTVAFSPDGRWFVTGSYDRTLRLWAMDKDSPSLSPIVLSGHDGPISALAISPDSRWLITASGDILGTNDANVRMWNLKLDGLLTSARESINGVDHDESQVARRSVIESSPVNR